MERGPGGPERTLTDKRKGENRVYAGDGDPWEGFSRKSQFGGTGLSRGGRDPDDPQGGKREIGEKFGDESPGHRLAEGPYQD